jgi:hypothetical protein
MNPDEPYSFRMERTSYKSQHLIYEEPGHRLQVYLEMSGIRQFDWVGSDTELRQWTDPPGDPISEAKREQILDRLAEWGRLKKVRIDIGPPMDPADYFADLERSGYTMENRADGTTAWIPPPRPFWPSILWSAFFGCLAGIGEIFGSSPHLLLAGIFYVVSFLGWIFVLAQLNGSGKVTLQGFIAVLLFFSLWFLVPQVAGAR